MSLMFAPKLGLQKKLLLFRSQSKRPLSQCLFTGVCASLCPPLRSCSVSPLPPSSLALPHTHRALLCPVRCPLTCDHGGIPRCTCARFFAAVQHDIVNPCNSDSWVTLCVSGNNSLAPPAPRLGPQEPNTNTKTATTEFSPHRYRTRTLLLHATRRPDQTGPE
jgi:hypothetical protein